MTEILHPDWLTVAVDGAPYVGYTQNWYPQKRQQLAGCGPTVGAMIAAYQWRYQRGVKIETQDRALALMLDMWKYATPRMHGLYKTRWLKEGLTEYFRDHELRGTPEMLSWGLHPHARAHPSAK